MCGIVGVVSKSPVNQFIYDSLLLLQHRGQDAAGIATTDGQSFYMHKGNGMVRDVFRTRNMRDLPGTVGIGQVRYPTAGSSSAAQAQPFYVNAPYGIVLAHNGNLTNWEQLKDEMFRVDRRHINTTSDSEVLLNVLAHELQESSRDGLSVASLFQAVGKVHGRLRGSYAIVSIISGFGLLAFRDPNGIRPLCIGRFDGPNGTEWMVASESVALEGMGFAFERDVKPGEAIFISNDGKLTSQQCSAVSSMHPCIFELVYLARPDSVLDGVPVYDARLRMGDYLAEKISREIVNYKDIDVVMPIPDSSRPAAMQVAKRLGLNYREGFFKNRYVGRTFIMPGQAMRKKSVRQKLNAMRVEFKDKNVLIVDDSIVRGTTSQEIVQMARDAGARKVIFASAAPPVKFPNVYGIDMPTRSELVAHDRSDEEVARIIGADELIYQDVEDMKAAVRDINPALSDFDASCFDGHYITGDVTPEYLNRLEQQRKAPKAPVVESGEGDENEPRGVQLGL